MRGKIKQGLHCGSGDKRNFFPGHGESPVGFLQILCVRGLGILADDLLGQLRIGAGHLDGTWERRLRRYLAPDLVILDDFGLRAFSERQGEDLYELISERVRRGSTIVTSNRPPSEWYALFPNPVLAEGALDRLVNASHHVTLEGKSYRPRQRPDVEERSASVSRGDLAGNEPVRSSKTSAKEGTSVTTLGAKAVTTKRSD